MPKTTCKRQTSLLPPLRPYKRFAGFPEDWLKSTFSAATMGNGIMAVLAGVVAQVAADKLGDIGPFQVHKMGKTKGTCR